MDLEIVSSYPCKMNRNDLGRYSVVNAQKDCINGFLVRSIEESVAVVVVNGSGFNFRVILLIGPVTAPEKIQRHN